MAIQGPEIMMLVVFQPLNGEVYQQNLQRHILAWKDVIRRIDVTIGPPVRPVRVTKRTKRQRIKPYSDKLGIHPDTHIVGSKYRLAWWLVFRQ